MILLQILQENNFLPTSKHPQAKVRRFLAICLYDWFIYRSNKCFETRRYLGSGRKTVNSQGYSELREPIKTRENCPRDRRWGKSIINFSFILRSSCYFLRSVHEAAELKTTYFQGKMQEFVGEWLERNNLPKEKSVFEDTF